VVIFAAEGMKMAIFNVEDAETMLTTADEVETVTSIAGDQVGMVTCKFGEEETVMFTVI
jgi:hypothetical protein